MNILSNYLLIHKNLSERYRKRRKRRKPTAKLTSNMIESTIDSVLPCFDDTLCLSTARFAHDDHCKMVRSPIVRITKISPVDLLSQAHPDLIAIDSSKAQKQYSKSGQWSHRDNSSDFRPIKQKYTAEKLAQPCLSERLSHFSKAFPKNMYIYAIYSLAPCRVVHIQLHERPRMKRSGTDRVGTAQSAFCISRGIEQKTQRRTMTCCKRATIQDQIIATKPITPYVERTDIPSRKVRSVADMDRPCWRLASEIEPWRVMKQHEESNN